MYNVAKSAGWQLQNGKQATELWQYAVGKNQSGNPIQSGSMASKADEQINYEDLVPKPNIYIATEGKSGGIVYPQRNKYKSIKPSSQEIDSYGCGDCFAGAVTASLAAKLTLNQAINIGAYCGAECSTHYGPY